MSFFSIHLLPPRWDVFLDLRMRITNDEPVQSSFAEHHCSNKRWSLQVFSDPRLFKSKQNWSNQRLKMESNGRKYAMPVVDLSGFLYCIPIFFNASQSAWSITCFLRKKSHFVRGLWTWDDDQKMFIHCLCMFAWCVHAIDIYSLWFA